MTFSRITSTLAGLAVPERPGGFGVRTAGWPVVHDVGMYGAPRWRLRQPMSPDDAWDLETLPQGRLLPAGSPVPEQFEWSYLTWADGSRAESGAAVLQALPPGRYLLVRSGLEPQPAPRVLLGNEWVPSPPNTRVLLDKRPFYAMLTGPDSGRPPVTVHPLVALIALNYVGDSHVHAALFFDGATPEQTTAPAAAGDLVLVIPVTGELVVDTMAEFSAELSARAKATWRDTGARQLATVLASWSALATHLNLGHEPR
jgi:hypothetical protein